MMQHRGVGGKVGGVLIVWLGTLIVSPSLWAAELADAPDRIAEDVAKQVDQLVEQTKGHDPDLANELRRQENVCLQDLRDGDGQLTTPELVHEVQTLREVQSEVASRVALAEANQATQLIGSENQELGQQLKTAFTTVLGRAGEGGTQAQGGTSGMPDLGAGGGTETISRDQAKTMFDKAYEQAKSVDPAGAERMKEMFDKAERGEVVVFEKPSPDQMERMHQEMERYMGDHPDMREYAMAEWDRAVEHGFSGGEHGSTESPEQGREAFEHWAAEGHTGVDVEHMRDMMERGFESGHESMTHEFERWAEGRDPTEVDRAREMMEHERDTSTILDGKVEILGSGGGGGGTPIEHRDLGGGVWDANNDGVGDHRHPGGTAAHSGSCCGETPL